MLRVDKDPDVVVGGVQGPVFTKVKSWISVGGLGTHCMDRHIVQAHGHIYTQTQTDTHRHGGGDSSVVRAPDS